MGPKLTNIEQQMLQNREKWPQRAQERPREPPKGPRESQSEAKGPKRCPKGHPKGFQRGSKRDPGRSQNGSQKGYQKRSKGCPKWIPEMSVTLIKPRGNNEFWSKSESVFPTGRTKTFQGAPIIYLLILKSGFGRNTLVVGVYSGRTSPEAVLSPLSRWWVRCPYPFATPGFRRSRIG